MIFKGVIIAIDRRMISTPKIRYLIVRGRLSVQRSGRLPVTDLESLANDIAESNISILYESSTEDKGC